MAAVDAAALDWLTERLLQAPAGDEAVTPVVATLLLRRYVATGRDDLRDALGYALARALEASGVERDANRRSGWLTLFVEASLLSDDDRLRPAADALVGALQALWPSRGDIAPAMRSVDACLSAASEDNANAVVPVAIDELERLIGLAYAPGEGLTHAIRDQSGEPGDLRDHVAAISALLTAHAVTGRLPYSMLAEELMQFARRTWWDELRGGFVASPEPFISNCESVRVLCRLAALHEDVGYRKAAVVARHADYVDDARRTLESLGLSYRDRGLDAALYAIALGEYLSLTS
jgi:hypothetical protein